MAAARKPAASKTSAGTKPNSTVEVILDVTAPKKHSVRFETIADGAALTSVYLANAAHKTLGEPSAIKITIEAADTSE